MSTCAAIHASCASHDEEWTLSVTRVGERVDRYVAVVAELAGALTG